MIKPHIGVLKTREGQPSKQKRNKVKIGIVSTIYLIQYLCILLFSKSCSEIESK